MAVQFPDLRSPEYPSSPEVLLSALAWSVVPRSAEKAGVGLIYQRPGASKEMKVKIQQTRPKDEGLDDFRASLQRQRWFVKEGEDLPIEVAEAAAEALLGVKAPKGVGYASSAMGLAGALLQDPIGGLGKKRPPNFANLLNTMYALGGNDNGQTAATKWFEVACYYAKAPHLEQIEEALADTVLKEFLAEGIWPPEKPVIAEGSGPTPAPKWWQHDVINVGTGTPFSWFRTSWDRLCSPEWYQSLPPRRWAGWAVCVLRNALGFTFLWEANFFLELARGIADTSRDPETVAQWALNPTRPLVPYQRGGVAQMDVMPSIKKLLMQGLACRQAILKAVKEVDAESESLASLVRALRAMPCNAVSAALTDRALPEDSKNYFYMVRYALQDRSSQDAPDHHALLKVVSRNYTHVAPGPEWIVVMSAMAARGPADVVRLGDVKASLEELGFKPRIDFLLEALERAGLCASASDGDEGIEINLGFGRK